MKLRVLSSIASLLLLLDLAVAQPASAPTERGVAPALNPELARRYGLLAPNPDALRRYGLSPATPSPSPVPGGYLSSGDRLGQLVADDTGPKLDFDFNGVALEAVVKEVENAYLKSKHHLSVIVPEVHSLFFNNTTVSIKVRQVTVGQFFELLEKASLRPPANNAVTPVEAMGVDPNTGMPLPPPPPQPRFIGYGFRLMNSDADNPIWMFYSDLPVNAAEPTSPSQPTMCRFFNLTPFLGDLKVEDITTVIRAGWEMLGNPKAARFMFHKETNILVVVGPERELQLIDQVLQELRTGRPTRRPDSLPGVAPAPRSN